MSAQPDEDTTARAADRIGRNEAIFREINERIADGRWPGEAGEAIAFRCECGNINCNQLVELTAREYERVRADSRRFLLLEGHEIPALEIVVDRGSGYVVVEKVGLAGEVAEASDPR